MSGDPEVNQLLIRIVEALLESADDNNAFFAALYSLGGALIGASAAIGAVYISERERAKRDRSEGIARLVHKVSIISNGIGGTYNHLKKCIARGGKVPANQWWKFVEECTGYTPLTEPIGDSELRALAHFKRADLYSDFCQLENAHRIIFEAMQKYNENREKLAELTAPFTKFHRVDGGMVMDTEYPVEQVPLAPGIAFKCESAIQEVLSIIEDSKVDLAKSISALNQIIRDNKNELHIQVEISAPRFMD